MNLTNSNYIEEIVSIIQSETNPKKLSEQLSNYHDNDIANSLERLSQIERKKLYKTLGIEKTSEIFAYLEDATSYLEEIELEKAAMIVEEMDSDDAVDILENIDEDISEKIINLMDEESTKDIKLIQSFDEEQIGSKMTTNFISIKKGLNVKETMKELIKQAEDNDNIYTIYISNEDDSFYGAMNLKDLITARQNTNLEQFISTAFPYVYATELVSDCLEKIKEYAEYSIPVLDENNKILGIITSQDIIEVVDEEMNDDYAKLAGLTEEEEHDETLLQSMKKRLPWLILLFLLGLFVSSVVGLFENVVKEISIIVCFQSLILGMAGNVGTQSLAVTIRSLMNENFDKSEKLKLIFKEIKIGFSNGLLLGIASFIFIGLYIWILNDYNILYSFSISGCVGTALMLSMGISSLVGTFVPIFLSNIKIDPAIASGPLITTVNDLVAVISYYGLAWILLLNIL